MYTNTLKQLEKSIGNLSEATYGDFLASCWAIECKVPDFAHNGYQAIRLALSEHDYDTAFLLYADYYSQSIRYLNAKGEEK
jgi:hypothetical protein